MKLEMPSTSAFVQQRYKIKPEAFKAVFDGFSSQLINNTTTDFRILAVDGSDIQTATNPDDPTSYHAHLIMYNFAEMITSHVVIEKKQESC